MFRSSILFLTLGLGTCVATISGAQTASVSSSRQVERITLTVFITGLRNSSGDVLVQLWNGPDGFPTKGNRNYKLLTVPAAIAIQGTISTTFEVAPGTYAVTTMHDENSNNRMDTNLLGIPKEGYGASNNVVTHLHAPSFDQSKFQASTPGQEISIAMRY